VQKVHPSRTHSDENAVAIDLESYNPLARAEVTGGVHRDLVETTAKTA
jgi:hypothetical protein